MDNVLDDAENRQISSPAPAGKLVDLLISFSSLRKNNRALRQALHGSIDELRELRSSLQKQRGLGAALNDGSGEHELTAHFGLTRRELQVARLLARGWSNFAIAQELKISAHTARHHTQRVLSKLEVHSRGEAAAKIRGS